MWGDNKPVYMISEVGLNHNADMQICKKLIDASFACNWDCVKFQKRTPELCVPEDQKGLMRDTPWGRMTYLQYRYKVEFEKAEYDYIDEYCKQKPIAWTASVWDMGALRFLVNYNVPYIKIPSAKLVHHELVRAAAIQGKPVILSTGMSTMAEIDAAVKILKRDASDFVLMHTNSAYPAPLNELNLSMIKTLKERYNCMVGYSGHEEGLEPSVIAVAMGARVIERHITLDHNMWGSDHRASLEVHAMDMLRKRIMDVDVSIGDGVKRITELENAAKIKLRTGTFR
jgi:N-acetylneuraminate synthase